MRLVLLVAAILGAASSAGLAHGTKASTSSLAETLKQRGAGNQKTISDYPNLFHPGTNQGSSGGTSGGGIDGHATIPILLPRSVNGSGNTTAGTATNTTNTTSGIGFVGLVPPVLSTSTDHKKGAKATKGSSSSTGSYYQGSYSKSPAPSTTPTPIVIGPGKKATKAPKSSPPTAFGASDAPSTGPNFSDAPSRAFSSKGMMKEKSGSGSSSHHPSSTFGLRDPKKGLSSSSSNSYDGNALSAPSASPHTVQPTRSEPKFNTKKDRSTKGITQGGGGRGTGNGSQPGGSGAGTGQGGGTVGSSSKAGAGGTKGMMSGSKLTKSSKYETYTPSVSSSPSSFFPPAAVPSAVSGPSPPPTTTASAGTQAPGTGMGTYDFACFTQ
jgi:hypothetical protein